MKMKLDAWIANMQQDAEANMREIRRLCRVLCAAGLAEESNAEKDIPQVYFQNVLKRVFPEENMIVLPDDETGEDPLGAALAMILFGLMTGQFLSAKGLDLMLLRYGQKVN